MDAQTALTLERDDIVLHQSQTYRVIAAFTGGYLLRLYGQHMTPVVPSAKCQLVYRKDEVPPGFTVGPLNPGEEYTLRAVIEERLRKEGQES